jgi:hypothetical protein
MANLTNYQQWQLDTYGYIMGACISEEEFENGEAERIRDNDKITAWEQRENNK